MPATKPDLSLKLKRKVKLLLQLSCPCRQLKPDPVAKLGFGYSNRQRNTAVFQTARVCAPHVPRKRNVLFCCSVAQARGKESLQWVGGVRLRN
eukprot:440454-Pelagomonas_calceolata.AAC.1